MLDEPAVELKVLEHAVEVVVELLRRARLGGEARVVELVRVVVLVVLEAVVGRVRVMMVLVVAGVLLELVLGVGRARARERGRVGDRERPARRDLAGRMLACGRRVGRVDRGAVVEAVLEATTQEGGDRRTTETSARAPQTARCRMRTIRRGSASGRTCDAPSNASNWSICSWGEVRVKGSCW